MTIDFKGSDDEIADQIRQRTDDYYDLQVMVNELSKRIDYHRPASSSKVTINAGGVAVGVAVTACISTLFVMIVFAVWCLSEFNRQEKTIDDLTQWRNVHSDKIAKLEAEVKK